MTTTHEPPTDDVQQTASSRGAGPRRARIGILGAGFAGLGMAIRLKQEGIEDFIVFERDSEVGGTWWANTYPGCQCDIPSHLYSYSFALNPDWTRTYPLQGELLEYLRRCAHHFGVRDHIRFHCEVTGADWDEEESVWRVRTSQGDFEVQMAVVAPGPLSEPSIPDLPGLESFGGEVFHTARWNHGHDLRGRRVAVVGTGASAIQAVPEIQQVAERVTVFQRTPPWVVPHRDRPITKAERRLYNRFPILQRLVRGFVYWARELLVPGLAYRPRLMKTIQRVAEAHLRSQVPDEKLRSKVTPDYLIGCKRILPSNDWYPALMKPNVELVPCGLSEVRPNGVVGADGKLHEVDTLIFATGFYVTDLPSARYLRGVGGTVLADMWNGSPQAYRGATIPGFPNLFLLVGPNTGLGHNSIVFMIEAQLAYLMSALRTMQARGASRVEVRRDAWQQYNERLQARMDRTVWNSGGCMSWYIDANGRNTTIWPDFTWRFWQQTRHFDEPAYVLSAPTRSSVAEAVAA